MDACGLADTTSHRPPLLPQPLLPRMSPLRLPLVPVQSQAVKDEIKAAMQEAGVL